MTWHMSSCLILKACACVCRAGVGRVLHHFLWLKYFSTCLRILLGCNNLKRWKDTATHTKKRQRKEFISACNFIPLFYWTTYKDTHPCTHTHISIQYDPFNFSVIFGWVYDYKKDSPAEAKTYLHMNTYIHMYIRASFRNGSTVGCNYCRGWSFGKITISLSMQGSSTESALLWNSGHSSYYRS